MLYIISPNRNLSILPQAGKKISKKNKCYLGPVIGARGYGRP